MKEDTFNQTVEKVTVTFTIKHSQNTLRRLWNSINTPSSTASKEINALFNDLLDAIKKEVNE